MPTRNKNIKIILKYVVGPVVFCILAFAISSQLHQQVNWRQSLRQVTSVLQGRSLWTVAAAFLLMFVNWGIEARKWQLSLSQEQPISFRRAYKAIFFGTTLAFFTPNRMGEYLGRILYIPEGKRIPSIALTIVCSIAQLIITLVTGVAGLLHLTNFTQIMKGEGIFWIDLLIYITLAGVIFLTIFYFRLAWLMKWLKMIPRLEKYLTYINVLDRFNATVLLRILSLSLTRYLIFVGQYYLLFSVFKVELDWWQTFWAVSVVFLVIAIVPSIAVLTELGMRSEASVMIVRLFSPNTTGILAASLSVWIINLVVPALLGSLLIPGLKIFRK